MLLGERDNLWKNFIRAFKRSIKRGQRDLIFAGRILDVDTYIN